MRVLTVGGGSGGHVTPVVAVLRELKRRDASIEFRFWCDRKFAPQARGIVHHFDKTIPVQVVLSGKLRRYNNLSVWRQLLRPFTIVIPNIVDTFLVVLGIMQSIVMLLFWRPNVVFAKGGFVCMPVGIAAKLLKIPLVIHDSDAHPGLTSRVLAKWAVAIATGAPLKHYPYPERISRYVGIPINNDFAPLDDKERDKIKADLGFDPKRPLILVTGGGLGAQRLNEAVSKRLDELLDIGSVLLISGTGHYDEMRAMTSQTDPRFQLHAFVSSGMSSLFGSADIVVARAGATTLLELAALARPTILVPNSYLTGGHQLKNAAAYAESGAVEVIDEHELDANPQLLVDTLTTLLANPAQLKRMSKAFHEFAKPHAARDVADMVIRAAK